jgi:predicted NAD-dependent protein-ADP-ribosyltransferase YbiA (DUF1768 family)
MPIYLFFVKPDLTCFYLIEREPFSTKKGFSFKQAKQFIIGTKIQAFEARALKPAPAQVPNPTEADIAP